MLYLNSQFVYNNNNNNKRTRDNTKMSKIDLVILYILVPGCTSKT